MSGGVYRGTGCRGGVSRGRCLETQLSRGGGVSGKGGVAGQGWAALGEKKGSVRKTGSGKDDRGAH